MALNAEMGDVDVYGAGDLDVEDAANALVADVRVESGEPDLERVPVGVDADMSVLGPEFKGAAGDVVAALERQDPDVLAEAEDSVEVEVDGDVVEVSADAFEPVNELRSGGREVEVVETDSEDVTVVVYTE